MVSQLPDYGCAAQRMFSRLQGPVFVAVATMLHVKPCRTSCFKGLRRHDFKSIRDLIAKLSANALPEEKEALRTRFLMCLYFSRQDMITDWSAYVFNLTQGTVYDELQEMFDEWQEINCPRATTLHRTIVLALRADPPLTCEQAAFCLERLPANLLMSTVDLLYKFLLRCCHSVTIEVTPNRQKKLSVLYTKEGPSLVFTSPL